MPSSNSGSNASRVILQINQAAKLLNVSKDTLRRWEREGKISSTRTSGGYRIYDITDLLTQVKSSKLRNLITSKYPELKPLTQDSPETSAKKLLRISQAAQTLGVSKDTLRRWEKSGKINASRTDSGYRIYDVTKLLETQKPKIKKTTFKIYQDDINYIAQAQYSPSGKFASSNEIKDITNSPLTTPLPNIALTDTVGRALEKDFIPSPHFSPEVSLSPFESASKFKNLFYSQLVNIFAVILLTLPGLLLLNYIKSNINNSNPSLSFANSKPVKTVTFASDLLDTFSPSLSYRILGNHPPGSPPGYLTQKLNNTLSPAQKRDLGYLNGGKKSGSNGSVLAESTPSGSFLQINLDTQINGSLSVNTASISGKLFADTVNTGFGDNEVYPMDQPLLVASTPSFASLTFTSGTNQIKLSNTTISTQTGGSGAYIASIPTLSANDDFVFAALAQTLTNKTISGSSNTFSNIPISALASSSITVSPGSGMSGGGAVSLGGSVTLTNAGVTSITGTSNRVIASAGTGGVTLSLPQDIATTSTPTFASQTLSNYLALSPASAPSPTTGNLYNVSGDLFWNGTNITAGGALPVGTSGQTLRHNGTSWTANSVLYNDGTNVGIGNSSPGSKLHVTGGITSSSTLSNTTAGSAALSYETTYARLMAVGADVFTNGMLRIVSSASDGTNLLNLIASDANGNVGVGTTAPSQAFQVNANASSPFVVTSAGKVGIGVTAPAANLSIQQTTDTQGTGGIRSYNSAGTSSLAILQGADSNTYIGNFGAGGMRFYTNSFGANGLNIQTNGNVGIGGITTVNRFLEVGTSTNTYERISTTATNQDAALEFYDGTTTSFIGQMGANSCGTGLSVYIGGCRALFSTSGNVGIGTTAPESKVHILGTTDPNVLLIDSVGTVASNLTGRRANGTVGTKTGVVADDNLLVLGGNGYTSAGSYSTLFPVRINMQAAGTWSGTSTPSQITFSTTPTASTAVAERMRIDSTGNVGIGTTAPVARLDVSYGPTSIADGATVYHQLLEGGPLDASLNGLYIGIHNQVTYNTTGTFTTIRGYNFSGGNSNTGTVTTVIGYESEPSNGGGGTIGTAISFRSVPVNSSGTMSTAFGFYAGAPSGTVGASYAFVSETGAGNVGIGTTAPSRPLHLQLSSSTTVNGQNIFTNQLGTGDAKMGFEINGVTGWDIGIDNSDSDTFKISNTTGTGDFTSTGLAINTTGNVGISNTNPAAQLHIGQGVANSKALIRYTSCQAASCAGSRTWESGVSNDGAGTGQFAYRIEDTSSALPGLRILYDSDGTGIKVGIGTTAPSKLLELGGANPVLSMNGSTSSRLMYNNTGVSAPNNSTAPVGEKITLWGDGLTTKYAIGVENSNIWFQTDSGFKWYEDTTVRMILSGGNVGIGGQTTSDRIVTVRSDTAAVGSNMGTLALMTATDTNRRLELGRDYTNNLGFIQAVTHGTGYVPLILQYNGGNVGLGAITSPATKLDIIGGINLQTSAEYSDTATGSRLVSTPNLHLDSANGATAMYFNYFGGSSGFNFCNGSASCPASISSGGVFTGTTINGTSYQVSGTTVLGIGSYTNLYANGGGYIQLLTQASGHIAYFGQSTFRTYAGIYPGQYPSGGDQASWALFSHSSYGLYTTTGFGITGTLYMGGSSTATVLNTNQLWCNNANPCYFNQAGTGATYLGNAAGTIAYLNTQSTLGTCNSVGGAPAYAYLYDCSSTPSDYAEGYGTPPGSEPGDVMVLTQEAHILTQSTIPYQGQVLGVISTDPNDFIGQTIEKSKNPQPIGLEGRLPVKVSLENGPIKKGDLLTSSSTPGVAMKATSPGMTIGMALEDYDGSVLISRETLVQEHNRTTDHPDLPEFHSDSSRWPAGVGKISFLARVQYANPAEALANLLIDDQGQLAGSATGNLKQITLNGDVSVTGKISASDFALDAAKLNSTGSLASVPVSKDNKVTISDAINTIDDRLSSIQNKQASQSAELAQARILGEQAVAQAESLDEKVASTSANIASLSSQINSLLGINSNDNLDLTPPSAISSTDSATIARLEVTDTLSTLNLDATDATVSSSLKSLGQTFLGETTIAGDISIDGAFSIKEGKSLNSLPILYLQDNPLAEKIDIFNGLITLDKTGLLKAQKLAVSDKSLGSVIIPAGDTYITISTTGLTDKSKVFVSTGKPVSIGVNSKNSSAHTFKIEISSALPDDLAVDWWIVDSE